MHESGNSKPGRPEGGTAQDFVATRHLAPDGPQRAERYNIGENVSLFPEFRRPWLLERVRHMEQTVASLPFHYRGRISQQYLGWQALEI